MAAIAAHAAVRCRNPRGWTWVHHALVVFLACAMPGGVGAFHGGLRHSLAGAAEHSLGAAGARVDMQTTRRTRQLPPTAMAAGREDRRAVLQSAAALSVLLGAAGPAGAIADFRRAVEIFGSDGDMPPGLLEQFGARIGKTMDKNFIDSKRRPQPVKVPRTEVYRPFAVLLMRSCYDAVDALNYVPMDKFQKDFFLLRQTEWEKYLEENDCKQGDLSNPMYFDFISAAQFATISQQMGEAQSVFEERTGAEGTVSVVARDQELQDNELLPSAFFKVAGDKMYAGLMANFTGELFFTQPPQPLPPDASDEEVLAGLTQLYKKMRELGYALKLRVGDEQQLPPQTLLAEAGTLKSFASAFGGSGAVPGTAANSLRPGAGRSITFTLDAPANLWGRQWLGMQDYLHTDHDVILAQAYLRQCGRTATVHTKVDSNSISRQFVLL